MIFLKILQANLQMQFTSTGNDVLTGVRDESRNTRIRLGEALKTFDQLGQVVGVLDFHRNLDDRGYGELHDLHVVGSLRSGEGTRLEQELINTKQTDNVASWDVLNRQITSHHENCALDGLDEQVLLATGRVVRTLNADPDGETPYSGRDRRASFRKSGKCICGPQKGQFYHLHSC